MEPKRLTTDDIFFVCNVCLGDFLNKPLRCGNISPLNKIACTEEDLVKIMDNYSRLDYEDRVFVKYNDVKVIKRGYSWNCANLCLGVQTPNSFAYQYKIRGTNQRVEAYYRHYEDNESSRAAIARRIARVKTTTRIPFFILQFSSNMCNCTTFSQRLLSMIMFAKSRYPYKMIITHEDLTRPHFKSWFTAANVFHTPLVHDQLIKPFFEHVSKHFPLLDAAKVLKELSYAH